MSLRAFYEQRARVSLALTHACLIKLTASPSVRTDMLSNGFTKKREDYREYMLHQDELRWHLLNPTTCCCFSKTDSVRRDLIKLSSDVQFRQMDAQEVADETECDSKATKLSRAVIKTVLTQIDATKVDNYPKVLSKFSTLASARKIDANIVRILSGIKTYGGDTISSWPDVKQREEQVAFIKDADQFKPKFNEQQSPYLHQFHGFSYPMYYRIPLWNPLHPIFSDET